MPPDQTRAENPLSPPPHSTNQTPLTNGRPKKENRKKSQGVGHLGRRPRGDGGRESQGKSETKEETRKKRKGEENKKQNKRKKAQEGGNHPSKEGGNHPSKEGWTLGMNGGLERSQPKREAGRRTVHRLHPRRAGATKEHRDQVFRTQGCSAEDRVEKQGSASGR